MKIRRLYIGDFGILRNQSLEDIHPGLVVIGGPNRAGKSTLMQILRYLGYGLPRGKGIPSASNNYEADADIKMATGDSYSLRLRGFGQPSIVGSDERSSTKVTGEGLYGIDNYTYGQLFTISLDELRAISEKSSDEKRRLQSMLLGAGFRDMLLAPQLAEEFYEEGNRIGGKLGNPSVKQFKPYYQRIEAGRKQRQKGLAQVTKYREKKEELEHIEKSINKVQDKVEALNHEITRLDIIKNNYDIYLRISDLHEILKDRKDYKWLKTPQEYDIDGLKKLRDRLEECKEKLYQKELEAGLDIDQRQVLINKKDDLSRYRVDISGIQERLRQYNDGIRRYKNNEVAIKADIRDIHEPWESKDVGEIFNIRTDQIRHHNLIQMVENHRELNGEYKTKLENLNQKKEQYKIFADRLKNTGDKEYFQGVKKYFYSSLILTIIGMILLFINPLSGIIIGVGGALGAAVQIMLTSRESKRAQKSLQTERNSAEMLKTEIATGEKALGKLKVKIESLGDNLKKVALDLGLEGDTSYSILPGHLERLRNIKNRIEEIRGLEKWLEIERVYLNKAYKDYSEFIKALGGKVHAEDSAGYRSEYWDRINSELERQENQLQDALSLRILESELDTIRGQIESIIEPYDSQGHFKGKDDKISDFIYKANRAIEYSSLEGELKEANRSILNSMKSDSIRNAFSLIDSNGQGLVKEKDFLNKFSKACHVYSSQEEAERYYNELIEDSNRIVVELEGLKEDKQRLENELEAQKTMDNLIEGQRKIHSGRAELKSLGDEYALNMAAAFLLREAEKNLLEGMKDSLMASAGEIFNKITGGQYEGILPSERVLESDFEALPTGDTPSQSMDILSRGTREQLYLSVRLSRIMEIKPCLPVIIDDCLVNFDSMHLENSLDILWELSKTHQIFLLTCHGDLIQEIGKYDGKAQYWKLDRGRLELSDRAKLAAYLA